jgi:DNA-binding protein YbaB
MTMSQKELQLQALKSQVQQLQTQLKEKEHVISETEFTLQSAVWNGVLFESLRSA